jgi:DNA polymerase-3 subunit alpha
MGILRVYVSPKISQRGNSMAFVNLHVHTMYSMLDGMGKISEMVARARALGQKALAITDHGKSMQ